LGIGPQGCDVPGLRVAGNCCAHARGGGGVSERKTPILLRLKVAVERHNARLDGAA
jgi:hypothetical protein